MIIFVPDDIGYSHLWDGVFIMFSQSSTMLPSGFFITLSPQPLTQDCQMKLEFNYPYGCQVTRIPQIFSLNDIFIFHRNCAIGLFLLIVLKTIKTFLKNIIYFFLQALTFFIMTHIPPAPAPHTHTYFQRKHTL